VRSSELTEARLKAAAELFNLIGHVYLVRVGKYSYYRLQAYTTELIEQQLLVDMLGGRMIKHMGRLHMWECSNKLGVFAACTKLIPHLTNVELLALAQKALKATTPRTNDPQARAAALKAQLAKLRG